MARLRRVQYDDLNTIIQKFRSEQQDIDALFKQTKGKVESLHNNQWVGEGSEKFFSEMESQVLPAMQRLAGALGHAGDVAQKMADTIRRHDEETKGFFNNLI
jgi:WXG100 family type VII secretion target